MKYFLPLCNFPLQLRQASYERNDDPSTDLVSLNLLMNNKKGNSNNTRESLNFLFLKSSWKPHQMLKTQVQVLWMSWIWLGLLDGAFVLRSSSFHPPLLFWLFVCWNCFPGHNTRIENEINSWEILRKATARSREALWARWEFKAWSKVFFYSNLMLLVL